jgi:hypothetical protein
MRMRLRGRVDPGAATETKRLVADATFFAVGALLMALSVVIGRDLLEVAEPPRGELFPAGAGIAPEVRPARGRGFLAGMGVRFTSCAEPRT